MEMSVTDLGFENLQLDTSGMLVDDSEYFNPDRPDVAIITPDGSTDEQEVEPLANDYEAMKARVLPELPDLETEAEGYHTWNIKDWRKLQRREHGPVFEVGGIPWRALFFPFGNNVEHASFYLEHGFEQKPAEDWYACVQFALVLWNTEDPSIFVQHTANHRFNADEGDWGFTRFCELRRLFHQTWEEKERSLVENDAANLTAYVRIVKDPTGVLWHNFVNYDSKKETGLVGLKNQGATCYLNSLLQSLYFTNTFRKAVFQIPTDAEQNKSNNAYALQRLFYLLQTNNFAVSTQELTHSFGWDTRQIFEQQDVQELSRVLMERLEMRMKGTEAETALPDLFRGRCRTHISCINVPYESNKPEEFWDIQLNVRKMKTLDDSFRDYLHAETMEGDNKYDAGPPYGLQDATTRIIFESFPPVLHLQLKRFEFDVERLQMVKLNDRHEFPEEFDASPYLSEETDRSEPWIYQLQGVLIHSGDINAGHYYAFLRPHKDGPFYKFDDDRVTRATLKETLEENYGGEYANLPNGTMGVRQPYARGYSTKRSMNAYMLVYIRKSRLDSILSPVDKVDIPPHVEQKILEERTDLERRRKEREEQHLYLQVLLITEENFRNHHGFDLATWEDNPQDPSTPKKYRILRTMKVSEFSAQIAEEKNIKPEEIRLWIMVNRQNKTTRPDQPLIDPTLTVEEAYNRYATKGPGFRLWAEYAEPQENGTIEWPFARAQDNNHPILIFLKFFDFETQTLTGVGHLYVKKHQRVADIASHILEIMKWPAGTQFTLYEEIKHSMIEAMKPKQTFQQSEIQDGDIICFQKLLAEKDIPIGGYNDVRDYYDYLNNRIQVRFFPKFQKEKESETDDFTLTLSKRMSYDQFAVKVGEHLGVDPTHIRFGIVLGNGKAGATVKRNINRTLVQILNPNMGGYAYNQQRNDCLCYEVLEQSLAEYETKRLLKVTWLPEGVTKEVDLELLVPKAGVISDVYQPLQKKANIDDETMLHIRLFEAHGGKLHKELDDNFNVAGVNDFVTLYAEVIPEDERNAAEGDRSIYVFHFDKEPNKPHGVPFKFVVKPGEVFKDTKERLSKRTGIKGKQFEKVKFAVVSRTVYSKPTYLQDDDVLFDIATEADDQLGLDHVNKTRSFWNRGDSIFIR